MDIFSWNERLDENKKEGQTQKKGLGKATSGKARVPSFKNIKTALDKAQYGTKFSTPKSDRIYVISKGTWGAKSKDKIVKGFPGDTPDREISGYSLRTKSKHGTGGKPPKTGEKGREKHGYATHANPDSVKNFKAVKGKDPKKHPGVAGSDKK